VALCHPAEYQGCPFSAGNPANLRNGGDYAVWLSKSTGVDDNDGQPEAAKLSDHGAILEERDDPNYALRLTMLHEMPKREFCPTPLLSQRHHYDNGRVGARAPRLRRRTGARGGPAT
jgi:hypothetical protein